MKALCAAILVLGTGLTALFTGGCLGYSVGPLQDRGIKTVAIPKVRNLTDEPRMSIDAASRLRNRFMTDGTLTVVSGNQADCVVSATVMSYRVGSAGSKKVTSRDPDQAVYTTSLWRVTVSLQYTVHKPGVKEPLIKSRIVSGTAEYSEVLDSDVSRRDAFRRALQEAAGKVVRDLTETW